MECYHTRHAYFTSFNVHVHVKLYDLGLPMMHIVPIQCSEVIKKSNSKDAINIIYHLLSG